MAFNPFETFSVRSRTGKSVMAVLGIVVMLTFVLSSGAVGSGMDFFDQIGSLFSSSKGRGPVVATAHGDKVRSSELAEVQRQRQAASEFLMRAEREAYNKWARSLEQDLRGSRLSAETRRDVERIVTARANMAQSDKDARDYSMFLGQLTNFRNMQGSPELQRLQQAFQRVRTQPDSDDKKFLDDLAAIILHDLAPGVFLVPFGTESDRDLLDFLLLLKKADQLGIRYSTDTIRDLVDRDTGNRLSDADMTKIEMRMRENSRLGDVSGSWLAEAVGNEYRARAALLAIEGRSPILEAMRAQRQQALMLPAIMLGITSPTIPPAPIQLSTVSAEPGALTPYEFFRFYKDRVSENTFDVLELRAAQFLDQVKEKPTREELKALFTKYRGELPNPGLERPGFKDPRKVQVQYVALDATAPRITQAVPKVEAASLFLSVSGGVLTGSPVAAVAQAAHPAIAETLPVREAVAEKMDANQSPYRPFEQFIFSPRDTSVFQPRPMISALGILAGYPDLSTMAAAVASVQQNVERIDLRTRVPFLLQPVLTPFNPTLGNALGMPAFAYALNPTLPPEGLYRAEAVAAAEKKQRQNLFEADVRKLLDELQKRTTGDDPFGLSKPSKEKLEKGREEAKTYLAVWLKDRGLTPAGTPDPVDQFAAVGSAELKPLNDLAVPEPDGTNSLTRMLFPDETPSRFGPPPGAKPYQPFWFPGQPAGAALDKPNYLVWGADEIEPRVYNTLDNADRLTGGEMTKRVERAWRLEKARALAKAEADRLAEQVRTIAKDTASNPQGVERQLKDLAAQKNLRWFEIDRLAKLKFQHGATQAQQSYQAPTIDKALVLYPTPDFADKLLELRKEPLGAVTVVADAPRERYYVAALMSKTEKSVEQFREVFEKTTATGAAKNPLYEQFAMPEEQIQAIEDVRLRLRADAGLELTDAFRTRDRQDSE